MKKTQIKTEVPHSSINSCAECNYLMHIGIYGHVCGLYQKINIDSRLYECIENSKTHEKFVNLTFKE